MGGSIACQNHLHFQIGDLCGLAIRRTAKKFRLSPEQFEATETTIY